jgi:hypothetical protein
MFINGVTLGGKSLSEVEELLMHARSPVKIGLATKHFNTKAAAQVCVGTRMYACMSPLLVVVLSPRLLPFPCLMVL